MAGRGRLVVLLAVVVVGFGVGSEVIKLLTANTTKIEVASVDIPVGTQITSSMIQTKLVHNDGLEPGVIKASDDASLVGQYSTQAILPGQQLTNSNVNTGKGSGLSAQIPKGDLAVTIPVNAQTGLTSSLSTGDEVDLIGSATAGSGQSQSIVSNFIAQNAPVLAVQFDPDDKTSMTGLEVAVTPQVAVDIEELLALGNGTNNGQVRVVMPGAGQSSNLTSMATDSASIINSLKN